MGAKLDAAAAALQAAQQNYEKVLKEELNGQEPATTQVKHPPKPPADSPRRVIDVNKITSIEDIILLMRWSGFQMHVHPEAENFSEVEHLCADPEDPESP